MIIVITATVLILKMLLGTSQITEKTPIVTTGEVANGFLAPTGIIATDEATDKHLFITERAGVIRKMTPGDKGAAQTFLDIQSKVRGEGEMGPPWSSIPPQLQTERLFLYQLHR